MVDGTNQALDNLQIEYTYHEHTGSEGTTANGCYTKANYHQHTGSSSSNGGCYTNPVYHTHSSSCYRECGGPFKAWSEEIYGQTVWHLYCDSCMYSYDTYSGNTYLEQINTPCKQTKEVCGKTEGSTIDSYSLSCGKTTTTITGYILGCGKTTATIESATIIY